MPNHAYLDDAFTQFAFLQNSHAEMPHRTHLIAHFGAHCFYQALLPNQKNTSIFHLLIHNNIMTRSLVFLRSGHTTGCQAPLRLDFDQWEIS